MNSGGHDGIYNYTIEYEWELIPMLDDFVQAVQLNSHDFSIEGLDEGRSIDFFFEQMSTYVADTMINSMIVEFWRDDPTLIPTEHIKECPWDQVYISSFMIDDEVAELTKNLLTDIQCLVSQTIRQPYIASILSATSLVTCKYDYFRLILALVERSE